MGEKDAAEGIVDCRNESSFALVLMIEGAFSKLTEMAMSVVLKQLPMVVYVAAVD